MDVHTFPPPLLPFSNACFHQRPYLGRMVERAENSIVVCDDASVDVSSNFPDYIERLGALCFFTQ